MYETDQLLVAGLPCVQNNDVQHTQRTISWSVESFHDGDAARDTASCDRLQQLANVYYSLYVSRYPMTPLYSTASQYSTIHDNDSIVSDRFVLQMETTGGWTAVALGFIQTASDTPSVHFGCVRSTRNNMSVASA